MQSFLSRALTLLLPALFLCSCATNSVVNLSHYDPARPDFAQMRSEGIVGVIHEATYPPRIVDAKYADRQDTAVRAGLFWGAYHFANATDPIAQADHFVDAVAQAWRGSGHAGRSPGVLLVLDFEKNGHYPGGTMRPEQAAAFAERVRQRTGKYPGLYSNENRIKTVLGDPAIDPATRRTLSRCWLWIANYHYQPGKMPIWGRWDLWQYTGDGVCDLPRTSYPTRVANVRNAERNIFRGSRGALRSFWREHAWQPAG